VHIGTTIGEVTTRGRWQLLDFNPEEASHIYDYCSKEMVAIMLRPEITLVSH